MYSNALSWPFCGTRCLIRSQLRPDMDSRRVTVVGRCGEVAFIIACTAITDVRTGDVALKPRMHSAKC